MATKKKTHPKRSANFVPQLLLALQTNARFSCKFSDLPKSYQEQPYNLQSKIAERGGVPVSIVFNRDNDTFVVLKIVTSQKPTTTTTKTEHAR